MWDDQFEVFGRKYKVIRYDVRGFGKSDRPNERFSDASDLHTLLRHLNIDKAGVLGLSNGGRIALDFVVEYPQMVDALVLVDFGVSGYETSGADEERLWDEVANQEKAQRAAVKENRISGAVEIDVNIWAPAQSPASRKRILEIAMENSHIHLKHPSELQLSPNPPAFKRLTDIRVPTLMIAGDRDVPGQLVVVDRIHSMVRGSKKVVLHGADHIANMSKPVEFNETVLEFLSSRL
jgi:pimeloyl-ACP methyl ester carboxylesterase